MAIEYKCDFCNEPLKETERTTVQMVFKFPPGYAVKTATIPQNIDLHPACAEQAREKTFRMVR